MFFFLNKIDLHFLINSNYIFRQINGKIKNTISNIQLKVILIINI